jgi:uncharacterized membrane protein
MWKFDTPDGAEAALRTLERLQTQGLLTVDDASVVVWPIGTRRPRTYQAGPAAGAAALSGAFWGLLFGLLFLLPLVGVAFAGAAGAAAGLARVGLSDEFLRGIRARVTPGTSALFLLTHDAAVDQIREALAGTHADLLASNLDREQEAALREAFTADEMTVR